MEIVTGLLRPFCVKSEFCNQRISTFMTSWSCSAACGNIPI